MTSTRTPDPASIRDITLDRTSPLERTPALGGARLVPAGDRLWRVVSASGGIIGHLGVSGEGAARRYLALRYHPLDRRFRELGSFWSAADAVECLRWSR
jgi:hypothetical protein